MGKKTEVGEDMGTAPTIFWRKSYRVQAVKITEENIGEIAEHLGVDYIGEPTDRDDISTPHLLSARKGYGCIGDWLVVYQNDDFRFFPDKVFAEEFRAPEQLSADDKYAKVHQLIVNAMHIQAQASFHGDTDGMDLVAIETTKKLLEEL